MRTTKRFAALLIVALLVLVLVAPDANARSDKRERKGQFVFSFGVSAYHGSNTAGPGWLAQVGFGYAFNKWFTLMMTTGYGHYAIEDERRGHDGSRGVDFVPLMLTGTVHLAPGFPVNPYVSLGGGTTFSRIEGDVWRATPSVQAGGGVNISAGPLGFSLGASYVIQDFEDFPDGYWTYGIGGGIGISAAF